MNQSIVMAANTSWNLVNFRAGLIRKFKQNGFEVIALAPSDGYEKKLIEMGCKYIPIEFENLSINPGSQLVLLSKYWKALRTSSASMYISFTAKPNIYGTLAARSLGIPVINNISGLGSTLISESWVSVVVRILYRIALRHRGRIFFQNSDDRDLFVGTGLVRKANAEIIPGSGVDLRKFRTTPLIKKSQNEMTFLFTGRLLLDKGVVEYFEAASILRGKYPDWRFKVLGKTDPGNPTSISEEDLSIWSKQDGMEFLGAVDDVRTVYETADCVVLPSYREGTPKALLEAAAMARPIVTTDTTGCRDVVVRNRTGYLCRVKDSMHLAHKMEKMGNLPIAELAAFGKAGRKYIEKNYDEKIVIESYMRSVRGLLLSSKKLGGF